MIGLAQLPPDHIDLADLDAAGLLLDPSARIEPGTALPLWAWVALAAMVLHPRSWSAARLAALEIQPSPPSPPSPPSESPDAAGAGLLGWVSCLGSCSAPSPASGCLPQATVPPASARVLRKRAML